jgi:Flp pilus assembly protein TadG
MLIRNQKGVAAVEFAIVLPVLVLILFGTIEFGLLLFNKQVITNASREGARAGIVAPDATALRIPFSEIESVVNTYCASNLISFGATPAAPSTATNPASPTVQNFGDDLTVTVTYPYTFLVLNNLGFAPINLTARTVMKYE